MMTAKWRSFVFLKHYRFCAKRLLKNKKALTARNCEGSFFYSGININMNVMPIMEFTLLGLSSEVILCITLKQRKIADF